MIFGRSRKLLGDPQADIGGAGDQDRVGDAFHRAGQGCPAMAGAAKKPVIIADEDVAPSIERGKLRARFSRSGVPSYRRECRVQAASAASTIGR